MLASEGGLFENGPGRIGVRVAATVDPPGIVAHPLVEVHRFSSPGLLEEKVEYDGIVIQTLVDESDSGQLASQRIAPRGGQVGVDSIQGSAKIDAIAKVLQGAPRPRFTAKAARPVPHRSHIAEQIQHQHPRVRHGAKERFDAGLGPELGLVVKRPSLQKPDRLRVSLGHPLVDSPTGRREEITLPARRGHLDESVGGVEVIGAKHLPLLLEKDGGHSIEEGIQRVQ